MNFSFCAPITSPALAFAPAALSETASTACLDAFFMSSLVSLPDLGANNIPPTAPAATPAATPAAAVLAFLIFSALIFACLFAWIF